jgi:nitronate monooxygenase
MDSEAREKFRAMTRRMRLPVVVAPMFLVSGPRLALAARQAGLAASIPFPNARTLDQLEDWLAEACDPGLGDLPPFCANMLTHSSYDRLADEIALLARYRPEVVITALGGPRPVVEAVHGYGGLVFADVNSIPLARKAVDAGADGLVLVGAGAGGHTGPMSGFAMVQAVRSFFDGPLVLAGALGTGRAVRAAEVLGADLAYMGTRFIAAAESQASEEYREMVLAAQFQDLTLSSALTGAHAYYLKASLRRMGLDPDNPTPRSSGPDFANSQAQIKAWRDVWSAGHGVGSVDRVASIADIVDELEREYREALATPGFRGG